MEFVIFLLFPLLMIITIIRITSSKSKGRRVRIITTMLVVPFLIFFADGIIGNMYLKLLCNTKAGVTIYKQVELPLEFWTNNKLNIFNKHENLKRNFWQRYIIRKGNTEKKLFNFEKSTSKLTYTNSNANFDTYFAEIVTYRFWGGWLNQFMFSHNSANSCNFVHDNNFDYDLYTKVFIKPLKK